MPTPPPSATPATSTRAKYIDLQRTQFKRLGVLGDWDNPYLTLNKEYEADELRLFAEIVEQGFVYRGKKPVYWSIPCRTALAEAEVEYHDHVSQSIFVKFPVVDQPGTFVLIWTTTPWTLPANLAVAYHKGLHYVKVAVADEQFILYRGLLQGIVEKCGWTEYHEEPFAADELARLQYMHPFCNRTGKAFAADFVTADTGTGFVHIAPGHGMDDYSLGLSQGLPIYSPVDDDGRFTHTNELPVDQQMPAGMVYYGWSSNKSRGERAKGQPVAERPARQKGPGGRDARKRWAALIKQVYEVDPLLCPKCGATMKIISFIERHQREVIEKILRHCELWEEDLARGPPVQEMALS